MASIVDSSYWCFAITCFACLGFSSTWQPVITNGAQQGCTDSVLCAVLCIQRGQCWRTCMLVWLAFATFWKISWTVWHGVACDSGQQEFLCERGKAEKWSHELGTTRKNFWIQFQVHHNNKDSVNTTLPCTTLGSSSAVLTTVMDVKTMTQSVPYSSNFEKKSDTQ